MYKLDIGGTNLRLFKNGTIICSKAINGNINLNPNIITEISKFIDEINEIDEILIGVAGYYSCSEELKKNFKNMLDQKQLRYQLVSDAEFHAIDLIDKNQLLFSLGTGSVASYYDNTGEFTILGGYGHVLTDYGSGYHFGKNCVISYLNDYEAGKRYSYMYKVEGYLGVTGRAVLTMILNNEKHCLSKLSKVFMDDKDFDLIFEMYFNEFYLELSRCMKVSQKCQVVINGSVTNSISFVNAINKIDTKIIIK